MNKSRRERLKSSLELLHRAENVIDQVCDEEKDSLSNMPENLERSDRYEAMENAISYLEDAIDNIRSAADSIGEAVSV